MSSPWPPGRFEGQLEAWVKVTPHWTRLSQVSCVVQPPCPWSRVRPHLNDVDGRGGRQSWNKNERLQATETKNVPQPRKGGSHDERKPRDIKKTLASSLFLKVDSKIHDLLKHVSKRLHLSHQEKNEVLWILWQNYIRTWSGILLALTKGCLWNLFHPLVAYTVEFFIRHQLQPRDIPNPHPNSCPDSTHHTSLTDQSPIKKPEATCSITSTATVQPPAVVALWNSSLPPALSSNTYHQKNGLPFLLAQFTYLVEEWMNPKTQDSLHPSTKSLWTRSSLLQLWSLTPFHHSSPLMTTDFISMEKKDELNGHVNYQESNMKREETNSLEAQPMVDGFHDQTTSRHEIFPQDAIPFLCKDDSRQWCLNNVQGESAESPRHVQVMEGSSVIIVEDCSNLVLDIPLAVDAIFLSRCSHTKLVAETILYLIHLNSCQNLNIFINQSCGKINLVMSENVILHLSESSRYTPCFTSCCFNIQLTTIRLSTNGELLPDDSPLEKNLPHQFTFTLQPETHSWSIKTYLDQDVEPVDPKILHSFQDTPNPSTNQKSSLSLNSLDLIYDQSIGKGVDNCQQCHEDSDIPVSDAPSASQWPSSVSTEEAIVNQNDSTNPTMFVNFIQNNHDDSFSLQNDQNGWGLYDNEETLFTSSNHPSFPNTFDFFSDTSLTNISSNLPFYDTHQESFQKSFQSDSNTNERTIPLLSLNKKVSDVTNPTYSNASFSDQQTVEKKNENVSPFPLSNPSTVFNSNSGKIKPQTRHRRVTPRSVVNHPHRSFHDVFNKSSTLQVHLHQSFLYRSAPYFFYSSILMNHKHSHRIREFTHSIQSDAHITQAFPVVDSLAVFNFDAHRRVDDPFRDKNRHLSPKNIPSSSSSFRIKTASYPKKRKTSILLNIHEDDVRYSFPLGFHLSREFIKEKVTHRLVLSLPWTHCLSQRSSPSLPTSCTPLLMKKWIQTSKLTPQNTSQSSSSVVIVTPSHQHCKQSNDLTLCVRNYFPLNPIVYAGKTNSLMNSNQKTLKETRLCNPQVIQPLLLSNKAVLRSSAYLPFQMNVHANFDAGYIEKTLPNFEKLFELTPGLNQAYLTKRMEKPGQSPKDAITSSNMRVLNQIKPYNVIYAKPSKGLPTTQHVLASNMERAARDKPKTCLKNVSKKIDHISWTTKKTPSSCSEKQSNISPRDLKKETNGQQQITHRETEKCSKDTTPDSLNPYSMWVHRDEVSTMMDSCNVEEPRIMEKNPTTRSCEDLKQIFTLQDTEKEKKRRNSSTYTRFLGKVRSFDTSQLKRKPFKEPQSKRKVVMNETTENCEIFEEDHPMLNQLREDVYEIFSQETQHDITKKRDSWHEGECCFIDGETSRSDFSGETFPLLNRRLRSESSFFPEVVLKREIPKRIYFRKRKSAVVSLSSM